MNPILNSDQLNSEIDEILDGVCASFARDMAAQSSIRLRDMDKVKHYYTYKEAKAAIQTLINKAIVAELKEVRFNQGLFTPKKFHLDHKYMLGIIDDRIAELSTQEENNE